jgi:hypothetical protein
MTQGFYSLDEAAKKLGVAPDELNRMAQRREIRAFSERGSWKFRTQDIDERARQGGAAPAASPGLADTVGLPSGGDLIPSGADDPLFLEDAPPKPASGVKKPTSGVKKPTSGVKKPKSDVKSGAAPGSALDDDLIPVDDDIFSANLDTLGHGSGLGQSESIFGGDDDDAVALGDDLGTPAAKPPSSGSGSRMVMEQGSFEFELSGDSGLRLDDDPPKKSSGRLKSAGDSDVRLDFEAGGSVDDSLVPAVKGDTDVRLTPGNAPLNLDEPFSQTEEIDLDKELQQADEASMKRRGNTTKAFPPRGAAPGPGKTKAPPQAKGTMLPESSPFELSEEDLGLPESSESVNQPMGSEFELTLAPEEENAPSPLSLGDDEGVELGDLPPSGGTGSGVRAELSGVNLHDPADSGISLEEDEGSDDSVSFDLTLDDGDTGPKTLKGKMPSEDSDSEFELTLDDTPGASGPSLTAGGAPSLEEKDIFETDFDLPALEDESASQAVALDEADTDLESSDFDLAVDSSSKLGEVGSTSGAMALDEAPSGGSMESVDEMLLEEEETQSHPDLDEEEEEEDVATIPAAEAEWGTAPVIVMACSIFVMFIGAIMAFELMHGMWGYHTASKPAGVVARSIAEIFTDLPKE